MLRLFFIVNLFSISLLHDQIKEDLNLIADHSFTDKELKGWFEELSKTKAVLYCKIRKLCSDSKWFRGSTRGLFLVKTRGPGSLLYCNEWTETRWRHVLFWSYRTLRLPATFWILKKMVIEKRSRWFFELYCTADKKLDMKTTLTRNALSSERNV